MKRFVSVKRFVEVLAGHAFFAMITACVLGALYAAGHLAVLWLTTP